MIEVYFLAPAGSDVYPERCFYEDRNEAISDVEDSVLNSEYDHGEIHDGGNVTFFHWDSAAQTIVYEED